MRRMDVIITLVTVIICSSVIVMDDSDAAEKERLEVLDVLVDSGLMAVIVDGNVEGVVFHVFINDVEQPVVAYGQTIGRGCAIILAYDLPSGVHTIRLTNDSYEDIVFDHPMSEPLSVILSGTVTGSVTYGADTVVTISDGCTIAAGADITVLGELIIPEGAELIIGYGASLTVSGDVAMASVVNEGYLEVAGDMVIGYAGMTSEGGGSLYVTETGSFDIIHCGEMYPEGGDVLIPSAECRGNIHVASGRSLGMMLMTVLGGGSVDIDPHSGMALTGLAMFGILQLGADLNDGSDGVPEGGAYINGSFMVAVAFIFGNAQMDPAAHASLVNIPNTCFVWLYGWMTMYVVDDAQPITVGVIDRIPLENAWFDGVWLDSEGRDVSSRPVGSKGTEVVYPEVRYDVYNITVPSVPGVRDVLIDGYPMERDASGSFTHSVSVGTHRIACVTDDGRSPALDLVVNGNVSSGPLFETVGTPTDASGIDYILELRVQGLQPVSERYVVAMTSLTDSVIVSLISLDGLPIPEGTEAVTTFTVLEEMSAFGQTVYRPTPVTYTLSVCSENSTVCYEEYGLSEVLGDRYSVVNVSSVMEGVNHGSMTLYYREV